ncbi:MAG: hypothetical protein PUE91_10660 [Clostridiales bacterium]|nr:hypothetical protein [Clostridiales bacterium]
MTRLEEQIRIWREQEHLPVVRETQIQHTVERAKQAFYERERAQPCTYLSFVLLQARFMRKSWWAAQLAVLAVLWFGLYTMQDADFLRRGSGVLISTFVILMVPELWKNVRTQSTEVESASYFTLRQVYAARLTVFATVDMLLLSLFLAVTTMTVSLTLWDILIQFVIPFHVTCCICLRVLCSRLCSEYFAVALSLFWSAIWMWIVMNETIYTMISKPIWIALLVISAVYLVYAVRRVLQSANQSWEGNLIWN